MALRLIMGPSGSGKTHFLFEYAIKEADKHPDRNYIIVVPEQFTLSTQRELIRLSDKHGILNIDVLSFNRLAYRIFEEVGFKDLSGSALDDMGKNLILMHVAAGLGNELTVFSGNISSLGYITEIKSAISEFMQYGINADKLTEMIRQSERSGKTLLAEKLKDILKLYDAFYGYTKDKYITTEEVLTKAAGIVYKSNKLKQSVILFDGFTGYTPVQYELIESLLNITIDMYFTILMDSRDKEPYNKEHELFYLGYRTKEKLYSIAKNNNICIEKEYIIDDEVPKRFLTDEKLNNGSNYNTFQLAHLERNIFRPRRKTYIFNTDDMKKQTKTVNDEISLFCAFQPMDEVIKIAVEIRKVIESGNGYRYRDIAIATADMDGYIPQFKRIFKLYNIPYFIDRSQPVLLNPFIEFVRSLIGVITDDFSYNAVLKLLRSPFMRIDKREIDVFDNFILARGIKGYTSYHNGFAEKYRCNSKISRTFDLNTLDIIRQKLVDSLIYLTDLITYGDNITRKKSTIQVNVINQALISTFDMLSVEKSLSELTDKYIMTDDMFIEDHQLEYENIYKNTIVLLDKMTELLGDEIISFDEYGELLDAGFDEIRIGIIPKITDYIQIGDTTRSRFNDIRMLFIVGANDGYIPENNSISGVISDVEKEFLLENIPDVEFAPTARTRAYTGQLYLYMLMSKPKDRLFISFSKLNNNDESIKPSYIIKLITDMFPDISIETGYTSRYEEICNLASCQNVLADNIKDYDFVDLFKLIISESDNIDDDYNKLTKLVECAFSTGLMRANDSISKAVANVLYGNALVSSVTRLEEYAKCAFRYYLQYGLSLKERDIFSFDAKDMGTVFHSSLEKYASLLNNAGITWIDVDDNKRKELVSESVKASINGEIENVINSTFRNQYMIERMTRIVDKSVEVMTRQLKAGKFQPRSYELNFSSTDSIDAFTFKLSEEEIIKLSGKIDRLDTYEADDKVYIKIIDYKSGNLSLDLVEIYKGLQLQLVVYMNACKELISKETDKEIVPAGILYYHLDYPVAEGSIFTDENIIADDIFKALKMKGLVNSNEDVYRLIDKDFTAASDIIPVKINKDMSLSKSSSAVSTDDFNVISEYVNKKICDMGREILSGNIRQGSNINDKNKDCAYCPYKEICKFYLFNNSDNDDYAHDASRVGAGSDIDKDSVLEAMKREIGNG